MKLMLMSDLHLDHWNKRSDRITIPNNILEVKESVDVIIIAGDTHPDKNVRETFCLALENHFGVRVIHVNGNHDFYGSTLIHEPIQEYTINDIKFGCGTLWHKVGLMEEFNARYIPDFYEIIGWSPDLINAIHDDHSSKLFSDEFDVIVCHHAPSSFCVNEKWVGDRLNPFFYTDYSGKIVELSKTKLLVHGHMHDSVDFKLGKVRIVSNPLGYPSEFKSDWKPLIVEI